MPFIEAPTTFYLGRRYDPTTSQMADEIVYYDSRDLTTHAVVVGMTGSGKTGMCIAMLEEAVLDNIPAIAIDPKGDITNLLLTFPNLRTEDFAPWVNVDDARRAGLDPTEFAQDVAQQWRDGLASWSIVPQRIAAYKNAAHFTIYTPGSDAGLPISILDSFQPPREGWEGHEEFHRERISAITTALLALVGKNVEPVRDREHVLISNIFEAAWRSGRSLTVEDIILQIQKPPFPRLGVFDVDTFFPEKERFKLAMELNNIIAAPSFQTWISGQPLDIRRLLYTDEGKAKVSIFYLAHLNDAERSFMITLLLENMLAWMQTLSGTTSLRSILYFDEVFGHFPPAPRNPPTKEPLLRMLKQARAFGIGVILATQNPGDLDYKGLSNAGTWFIGKLQTDNDKKRVLGGLQSAATADSKLDMKGLDNLLGGLAPHVFVLHNVHDEGGPILMHTRWTMSYLRGPLTRQQIRNLMESQRQAAGIYTPPPPPALPQAEPSGAFPVGGATGGFTPVTPTPPSASFPPPPPPNLPGFNTGAAPAASGGTGATPTPPPTLPGMGGPSTPPPELPEERPARASTSGMPPASPLPETPTQTASRGSFLDRLQSTPTPPAPPSTPGHLERHNLLHPKEFDQTGGIDVPAPNFTGPDPGSTEPAGNTLPLESAQPIQRTGNVPAEYTENPPPLPSTVAQFYLPNTVTVQQAIREWEKKFGYQASAFGGSILLFRPVLLAQLMVRYLDRKRGVEADQRWAFHVPNVEKAGFVRWNDYAATPVEPSQIAQEPLSRGYYGVLAPGLTDAKRMTALKAEVVDYVYRSAALSIPYNSELDIYGAAGEARRDFLVRAQQLAREQRDNEIDQATVKYDRQIEELDRRRQRQLRELQGDQEVLKELRREDLYTTGEAALSLLKGRTSFTLSRMSRARRYKRQAQGRVSGSEQDVIDVEDQIEAKQNELAQVLQDVNDKWGRIAATVEDVKISPLKKDIALEAFGIGWIPFWQLTLNNQPLTLPAFAGANSADS